MKGLFVSYFALPSSIVKHSESEGKKGEGEIWGKSSMEANSRSAAGEMYLALFRHILLYCSNKIESLAFSSGVGKVKCPAHTSGPAV